MGIIIFCIIDIKNTSLNHLRAEVDKLQQLHTAVVRARDHKAITKQYERLKIFPGKFYKNHKLEIGRYRYAVKQLTDTDITQPFKQDAFMDRLKLLEAERDALAAKLPELQEELRMWCACAVYTRELLNLPKPSNIPDFSVQPKSDRLNTSKNLFTIASVMGWGDLKMLRQRYAHADIESAKSDLGL